MDLLKSGRREAMGFAGDDVACAMNRRAEWGEPLGYFRDRPFFLVRGAEDSGATDDPGNGAEDEGGDGGDVDPDTGTGVSDDAGDGSGRGTDDSAPPKGKAKPSGDPKPTGDDPTAGLKRALDSERALRKQRDTELRELKKKHASAEELALLQAREAGASEATASITPKLMKRTAAAELRAAGASGNTAKLAGLLDLSKVEMTDDGELVGLDDQIEELKEEFPNLFSMANGKAPARPPAGKGNAGSGGTQGRTKDHDGTRQNQGRTELKNGERGFGFADKLADSVLNPR
jgi:hypothetical protein